MERRRFSERESALRPVAGAGRMNGGGGHVSINTSGGNPAMDYDEHNRTYSGFIKGTKYAIGLSVLTLILMAIFLL